MGATEYGEELKIIGIRKKRMAHEMAQDLGIHASLLSAVISGARKIPVGFTERLAEVYGLDDETVARLKALEAKAERNAVQINFKNLKSDLAKETAMVFADRIKSLDDEECEKLLEIMGVKIGGKQN